jgi:hypothetical protein
MSTKWFVATGAAIYPSHSNSRSDYDSPPGPSLAKMIDHTCSGAVEQSALVAASTLFYARRKIGGLRTITI